MSVFISFATVYFRLPFVSSVYFRWFLSWSSQYIHTDRLIKSKYICPAQHFLKITQGLILHSYLSQQAPSTGWNGVRVLTRARSAGTSTWERTFPMVFLSFKKKKPKNHHVRVFQREPWQFRNQAPKTSCAYSIQILLFVYKHHCQTPLHPFRKEQCYSRFGTHKCKSLNLRTKDVSVVMLYYNHILHWHFHSYSLWCN